MNAIQMKNVTKQFGNYKANDNINLEVKKGEIHAILGENGAGKSTLMKLLFGIYTLDSGEIYINNKKVKLNSPNDAFANGIGMVHQHFQLIDVFTIFENITLGEEPRNLFNPQYKKMKKQVQQLIQKYNFNLNVDDKISSLTVGQEQKVEILKILYRNSDILIFDEPTGVLTPQETKEFLQILEQLKKEGKTIILITHKLNEIKAVADRCTVIRKGKKITVLDVESTTEKELATAMVGREVDLMTNKGETKPGDVVLSLKNINYTNKKINKLKNINLNLQKGKILGIAGVDNNGQKELVDILSGLITPTSGQIIHGNEEKQQDITKWNVRQRIKEKIVSHIPEDRQKEGLVLEYTVAENAVLIDYHEEKFSNKILLNHEEIKKYGEHIINKYDVRSAYGIDSKAEQLSGGNQQKLIIGRQIETNADVIIAFQPTRGVDVGAIEGIHKKLLEEKQKGKAILLISMELNEIFSLSDDIAVIHDGEIMGVVEADSITKDEIGLMMAGKEISK